MGVEHLFSTFFHNKMINGKSMKAWSKKLEPDHFFMDFNSLIHTTYQKLLRHINTLFDKSINITDAKEFEKLKTKFTKNTGSTLDIKFREDFTVYFNNDKLNTLVVEAVVLNIYEILEKYLDTSKLMTLYIALDGVPSKGKIMEQRRRRHLSTLETELRKKILLKHKDLLLKEKTEHGSNRYLFESKKIKWSNSNIKPGTKFMSALSFALKHEDHIKKVKKLCPKLVFYIVSDDEAFGEGENKFIDYIRKLRKKFGIDDKFVISSPDSDLMLLLMLLEFKNIEILRYNQQLYQYDVIDITKMKDNIFKYISGKLEKHDFVLDRDLIAKDFVFICTFFGNDFLPKVESHLVKYSFDKVLKSYIKTIIKEGAYMLSSVNEVFFINFDIFITFLEHLSKGEKDILYDNLKGKRKDREPDKTLNAYDKELHDIVNMTGPFKKMFNVRTTSCNDQKTCIDNYYKEYYKDLNVMISKYIEGLMWVVNYYYHIDQGLSNWYYPYKKAPLFTDILDFLKKKNKKKVFYCQTYKEVNRHNVKSMRDYFTPVEQLLYNSTSNNDDNKILPRGYREFVDKHNINLNPIITKIWEEKTNKEIDCVNAPYLSQCSLSVSLQDTMYKDDDYREMVRQQVEYYKKKRGIYTKIFKVA
jgi:5'-3' exonuclease